jgi:hypothetical protein
MAVEKSKQDVSVIKFERGDFVSFNKRSYDRGSWLNDYVWGTLTDVVVVGIVDKVSAYTSIGIRIPSKKTLLWVPSTRLRYATHNDLKREIFRKFEFNMMTEILLNFNFRNKCELRIGGWDDSYFNLIEGERRFIIPRIAIIAYSKAKFDIDCCVREIRKLDKKGGK